MNTILSKRPLGGINGHNFLLAFYAALSLLIPPLVEGKTERNPVQDVSIGEEKEIVPFFTDIHNFSVLAAKLKNPEIALLMNEYFTEVTQILEIHGGFLDKYVGDAIIGRFGGDSNPIAFSIIQACFTACEMQKKQRELSARWASEGRWKLKYNMRTRIGFNAGSAFLGDIGHPLHATLSMLGDAVNIAARCESSAEYYGASILTTENIFTDPNLKIFLEGKFAFRPIDCVRFGDRPGAVILYELVGPLAELKPDAQRCLYFYREGFEAYKQQNWDEAARFFERALSLEHTLPYAVNAATNPSRLLLERCRHQKFTRNVPSVWPWVIEKQKAFSTRNALLAHPTGVEPVTF